MCRLENLLVAIELKDVMLSYFPEASQISASGVSHAYFALLMMKLLV
jgi:endoribonuclease Dicer